MVTLPAPAADPLAYLRELGEVASDYHVILPTHEQAWLIAAGLELLGTRVPIAVADLAAFDRVQSKIAFARLLDDLGLPQPVWWLPDSPPTVVPPTFWVKTEFGTAGRGVRRAHSPEQGRALARELGRDGSAVMCQAPAPGEYGQVQALFDHGRMFAAHTCVQTGTGIGGSAASRESVDHPLARDAAQTIGTALNWHGGLTLDYFHQDGYPHFIECNPRTVEPGNAAAAGVNLPALTIALTLGADLPVDCVTGIPGVRTHSSLALALGAAATSYRWGIVAALSSQGGPVVGSEVLTPIREDPLSAIPVAVTVSKTLVCPRSAETIAATAVDQYAITPALIDRVREAAS